EWLRLRATCIVGVLNPLIYDKIDFLRKIDHWICIAGIIALGSKDRLDIGVKINSALLEILGRDNS
ncbi:hypothetical protein, partial [Nostoc sp. NOS(2021)]|uniref:hypothetical protein n=1 Tax=Nostoc sp. NOS(2021) TaxID=2815407 RepID=UPI0025EDE7FD